MYRPKLLDRLERKLGRFAIPNLMTVIIFGMVLVYLIDTFTNPDYTFNLSSLLYFDRAAIFSGQVWRVLTFVFMPPNENLLFVVIELYFYYLIGSALERQWGSFRFNVYYLTGVIGTIIGGFITGFATNEYLNLSLFLAFAMLFPNFQVLLFFFIPIKIKYLAWIDAIFMFVQLIFSPWSARVMLIVAFANFLLFFGKDLLYHIKLLLRRIGLKLRPKKYSSTQEPEKRWKNHWWDDKDNDPFH